MHVLNAEDLYIIKTLASTVTLFFIMCKVISDIHIKLCKINLECSDQFNLHLVYRNLVLLFITVAF